MPEVTVRVVKTENMYEGSNVEKEHLHMICNIDRAFTK